ncbi:M20 family metallopeptidase [Arthrobacter sp. KK5.5]|uniref:M20 family metallopeptidase n=1 Tax=Arthrobacter sp. KK5.5 TaxID=3373084 RepID=UPI003EE74790
MTATQAVGLTGSERALVDAVDVDALVELACALVAAGGENPGGTEEATVVVLEEAAGRLGLEVLRDDVAPGRPNVLLTLPATTEAVGEGLLFLGHSDVVPVGPGWSREPFAPVVEDGRLYGRGSTDMKGGLASVLAAMAALKASGLPRGGPVTLACTVDEEDLGIGIRALARAGLPHRYAACVVAEPTDLETVIACRGDSYLEIAVTGRAAHSGRPSDGRNAIDAAARICALIAEDHKDLQGSLDPLLGAGSWNVGIIEGGRGTSIVAPECRISVDRRLMPFEDAQELCANLLRRISAAGIDGDGIEVGAEVTMSMPGFSTPADHPLVRSSTDALRDAGTASRVAGWTAACDGGFIARDFGVPTIVMGPGGLNDQAHQPDECVRLEELATAARAYALMATRLLTPNTSTTRGTPVRTEGRIL